MLGLPPRVGTYGERTMEVGEETQSHYNGVTYDDVRGDLLAIVGRHRLHAFGWELIYAIVEDELDVTVLPVLRHAFAKLVGVYIAQREIFVMDDGDVL